MAISDYSTALVTGASSGIGQACVRQLRERGLRVLAAARRRQRLDDLAAETGCEPLPLDLTDTEAVYAALAGHEIDVLVNNAGLGRGHGGFFQSSATDIDDMIKLNVSAAFHVTRAVVEGMIARRRGHIVQLGSIAGLYPIGFSVYGGTKGAVHLFSQHFRIELAGSGVRHTEICPGRVDTEFFDTAFTDDAEREAFRAGLELLRPEDVADAITFAIDAPARVNVSTIELTPTEQAPGGVVIQRTGEA